MAGGSRADDVLDALACAAVAQRIRAGKAEPFPIRRNTTFSACRWRSWRDWVRAGHHLARVDMPFPNRLVEGYRAFLGGRLRAEQDRYRELSESGQSPQVMVIGCCDSRVSPEVIFDARPGELFVVRNVANLVPPYAPDGRAHGVSAALEFGVAALKIQHIVVLGHAQCGGVRAFAEDAEPLSPGDFIGKWMSLMAPALEKVGPRGALSPSAYLTQLEQANVTNGLDNLMTFPRLRKLIERGQVAIHGAYFGVATGQLSVRDDVTGQFMPVAAEDHARLFAQPRF